MGKRESFPFSYILKKKKKTTNHINKILYNIVQHPNYFQAHKKDKTTFEKS